MYHHTFGLRDRRWRLTADFHERIIDNIEECSYAPGCDLLAVKIQIKQDNKKVAVRIHVIQQL